MFSQNDEDDSDIKTVKITLCDTILYYGNFKVLKQKTKQLHINTVEHPRLFDTIGHWHSTYSISPGKIEFQSTESIHSEWKIHEIDEVFSISDSSLGILQYDIFGGGRSGIMCGGVVYYTLSLILLSENGFKKISIISTNGCNGNVYICNFPVTIDWENTYSLEENVVDYSDITEVSWEEFGKTLSIKNFHSENSSGKSIIDITSSEKDHCVLRSN